MKDDAYAYAVARIRANERNLLTEKDIQALIDCKSFGEAVDLLVSKNWAQKSSDDFSIAKAIGENQKKLWTLLCESVPEKEKLRVFTVQNDFFNLKAALKCMLTGKDPNELFAFPTSLDLKSVDAAVKNHDFSSLDPDFGQALKEAYEAAVQTQSGQNADIILDRAAVIYIEKLASQSKCELVEEISAFICAAAALKRRYGAREHKKAFPLLKARLRRAKCSTASCSQSSAHRVRKHCCLILKTPIFHSEQSFFRKAPPLLKNGATIRLLKNRKKLSLYSLGSSRFAPITLQSRQR